MPLSEESAKGLAKDMIGLHESERDVLNSIRLYWKGRQRLPGVIPNSAPAEIRTMARMARVNLIDIVVSSLTQSLYVDGVRDEKGNNVPAWTIWQRNRLDRGQISVHRAALAYGTSYVGVFGRGDDAAVRGFSPRRCTATYADDPDWPFAVIVMGDRGLWTLYDEESRYRLGDEHGHLSLIDVEPHGFDVPPFVRFRDEEDLDLDDEASDSRGFAGGTADHPIDHVAGQVAPMIPLQDQVDVTTFDLLSTQHYGAFRQKAVVGWEPKSTKDQLEAAANRMWTFGDHPDEIDFHEFTESDLKGYIDSRNETMRHGAALSQTPVHELTADLINLSAEALVASEAGRNRKVDERATGFGESWEQVLRLAGDAPEDSEVGWRETSAQAFAAVVDGLGKIAKMLQVPPQELWDRIPGTTQQEVERWKNTAQQGDALTDFTRLLDQQADDGVE